MNAFQFGAYVKLALDMNSMGTGAVGGGAIGAGLGGLAGLINPGRDERGNRKSRLMSALKGALGGGALGAAGGAALGHYNPDMVNSLAGQARGMYDAGASKLQGLMGNTPAPASPADGILKSPAPQAPQSPDELIQAYGEEPRV